MNEYTIIDTIQVTRIIRSDKEKEQEYINENGRVVIDKLIGFDDAIILDHKVFIRNVEDNSVDDAGNDMEERDENE